MNLILSILVISSIIGAVATGLVFAFIPKVEQRIIEKIDLDEILDDPNETIF